MAEGDANVHEYSSRNDSGRCIYAIACEECTNCSDGSTAVRKVKAKIREVMSATKLWPGFVD